MHVYCTYHVVHTVCSFGQITVCTMWYMVWWSKELVQHFSIEITQRYFPFHRHQSGPSIYLLATMNQVTISLTWSLGRMNESHREDPAQEDHQKDAFQAFQTQIQAPYQSLSPMEISSSLEDIGTFTPMMIALAKNCTLCFTWALFFTGLWNFITRYFWDVPMPVWPMKSIATMAIAHAWNAQMFVASGVMVGCLIFFVGISNLIRLVSWIIPIMVVSGMQLQLGLWLMTLGVLDVTKLVVWVGNSGDCILTALAVGIVALYWFPCAPYSCQETEPRIRQCW